MDSKKLHLGTGESGTKGASVWRLEVTSLSDSNIVMFLTQI